MKKFIITFANKIQVEESFTDRSYFALAQGGDDMQVNDGYHTMDELYNHRITLYIALCKYIAEDTNHAVSEGYAPEKQTPVWRSKIHSDGTTMDGWFILGINKEKGKQITYHIPVERWGETTFAEELEKAPEYDGHSSADVLERLKKL